MNNGSSLAECSLAEALIYQISLTVEDGILAFHGFGSPLVQLALHLAKRTHAPNMVLVAGATYGINPTPEFLTPTSNDWTMNRGAECSLGIEELFDLAASGRMGRMFLSGLQIDRWGNMNVTRLGNDHLKLKLPGGGGGCNLSCDANRLTIWTAAHRSQINSRNQRRYRLVKSCDFITNLGHRTDNGTPRSDMGVNGLGPDRLVTELGVFDFDASGQARLIAVYPDIDVDTIAEHTEFEFPVAEHLSVTKLPDRSMLEIIRVLDPMEVHCREIRPQDRNRYFTLDA